MIKIKTLLFLVLASTSSLATKVSSDDELLQLINKDFYLVHRIMDDMVFMEQPINKIGDLEYKNYVELVSIDTISGLVLDYGASKKLTMDYSSIDVFLIRVKPNNGLSMNMSWTMNKQFFQDTLEYVVLHKLGKFYKLFGFYHTNIKRFLTNTDLKSFVDFLQVNKILNRKQASLFFKSIKRKKIFYMAGVKRECEMLRYYSNSKGKSIQTRILPYSTIKPKTHANLKRE